MKRALPTLLALLLVTPAFSLTPLGEKEDGDSLREAQTHHVMFATEKDAAAARATLDGKQGANLFAEFQRLARARSKDPGSASRGGDLGMVREGEMVKPFEAALFALPINTVSQPVKTHFGWHLIYASYFRETPVREVCEQSLGDSIRKARPDERASLRKSLSLVPESEPAFGEGIAALLGDAWGAPLRGQTGNLAFMRVTDRPDPTGAATVTVHTELRSAVLSSAPLACRRSERIEFALNCRARTVALATHIEFEGRAGLGRRLGEKRLSPAQRAPERASPNTLADQMLNAACGVEMPSSAG
ncbi:peptidylprolyl isomerase [Roseateles chitinivorans]|uniref:peptidylprolyl isomerase n=1 Tax=Roseateles chitinivorans TaxID=2917965 RepID=UPI003D67EF90